MFSETFYCQTQSSCTKVISCIYRPTLSNVDHVNPSQTTNISLFEIEKLADHNFNFDENGRKFSELAKITVEKGEIARHVFSRDLYCGRVKTRACL